MSNTRHGLILTLTLAAIAATPAQANTSIFNWVTTTNANTGLGLQYAQSNNGITLTAYALTAPSNLAKTATTGPGLYAKSSGVGETGLGMTNDPGGDNEISAKLNDGIQIDFSDPLAKTPKATVTMTIESAQPGEGWALYGSNTLYTVAGPAKTMGTLGEPLMSGSANYPNSTASINLPDWGQYTYYTLMAVNANGCKPYANVVLGTVSISGGLTTTAQAPEPGSLVMAGSALIGLAVVLKKRHRS